MTNSSARAHLERALRLGPRGVALVLLATLALPTGGGRLGAAMDREVSLLTIDGVINPLTASYLTRGLEEAAAANAELVVLRLNTPGGLESSTRKMTEAMLGSPVPVVVYVAPAGARAASAGMFITIAAHVASMAPGTNIGAAHPVGMGAQTDSVRAGKVVNDAAALARAIAAARARNAAWAEQAVRQSVSITAAEALKEDVIDLVASDLEELLRRIDGRRVTTSTGEVTLRTVDAQVIENPMRFSERVLHTIADPNIAYILFTIGTVGLIAELYNPGMIFPGLTGLISLIVAFVAFGSLPVNWAGVLLLLLAVGLFVAELNAPGIGVLGVGGLIAFVLGSLMLYAPLGVSSPTLPQVRVSPWLVAGTAAGMAAFFGLVLRLVVRAQRVPVATGAEALVGRAGVAASDLAPTGTVRVDSEIWSALADDEVIPSGEAIEVVAVEGVTLRVRRLWLP